MPLFVKSGSIIPYYTSVEKNINTDVPLEIHGVEGAYATLKVNGRYIGASSRATSYPANPWENTTIQSDSNYTYFFKLNENLKDKDMEVFLLAYDEKNLSLRPEVWITAYPIPYERKTLVIHQYPMK